ncbi:MAG: radical SAM protein [Thaumarchaeota archaeon]|nr:MAG: radical SAM protein [Nitrososphaerota archaeon]
MSGKCFLDLEEEYERKLELAERLRSMLSPEEAREAEKDPHSFRLPRPCGLTVHTGVGCSFGCLYCYIRDMGFPSTPTPYPLTGAQLAYSIAVNPAAAMGLNGTLLAFGSVTEPFMRETRERAFEYLSAVSKFLGNPIQLSTKARLLSEDMARLKELVPRGSILVTIVTLSFSRLLEPGAPTPEERFETLREMVKLGLHVALFLRPILPGLAESEFEEILEAAKDAGVRGVVLGSLRITRGIIERLRRAGYPHLDEILSRVPREPEGSAQVTIRGADLKEKVREIARELGLKVYPAACSASIDSHELGCWACAMGPCGDLSRVPSFDPDSLERAARRFGLRVEVLRESGFKLFLGVKGDSRRRKYFLEFVKALLKRRMVLR